MKKTNQLKQGDKIYYVDFRSVKWYTYFCVHPNNKAYHIVIDGNEDTKKIYENKLQDLLDQNYKTYQEAKLGLANELEKDVARLRTEPISNG
jgi:hypothetical protein